MQPKFIGISKVLNNLATLCSRKTSSVYVCFIYYKYKNFMYTRDGIEDGSSILQIYTSEYLETYLLIGLLYCSVQILIFQENKILHQY